MLKKALLSLVFLSLYTIAPITYAVTVDVGSVEKISNLKNAQRQAFIKARDGIKNGDNTYAIKARKGILKDYALNVWLDYYELSVNPSVKKFNDVIKFINSKQHQELGNILQNKYIEFLSNKKEYKKVKILMPTKPILDKDAIYNSQKAKLCRFYEASWNLNQATDDAVAYARSLYLNLKPIPKSCNNLMSLFEVNGHLSDALVLKKFEKAYIQRNYKDTTHSLAKALSTTMYKDRVEKQMSYYDDPEAIFDSLNAKDQDARSVAVLAFKRFANVGANDARDSLKNFVKKFSPTDVDYISVVNIIANNCLSRSRPLADVKWVDDNLPAALWSNSLKEQRLRRAIWFSQWNIVYRLLEHMPSTFQEQVNWQYWKGISALKLGFKDQGLSILKKIAKERDFFGFMAAQKLNLKGAYNHKKLSSNAKWSKLISENASVIRFFELDAIGDSNASIEWHEAVKHSSDDDAMLMGQWALQTGNIRYAIDMVVQSKRWDALSYRFPIAYLEIYKKEAKANKVALSYIYGISRQESMLNATIRSPVGAVGLMQLMPTTARLVAKKNNIKYKRVSDLTKPELNVKLGSIYIKNMLDKFDNNRILAAAAYNAGPGRIPRWLSNDGKVRSVDAFVESIPFAETRKYVQNVVLYDAIYNYLLTGRKGKLLRDNELYYKY